LSGANAQESAAHFFPQLPSPQGGVKAAPVVKILRVQRPIACSLVAALLISGCTSSSKPVNKPGLTAAAKNADSEPDSATDPCAARLHDICGGLLLYYLTHKRLPANLDQMQSMPELDAPLTFTCPLSKLPYIYNPNGIMLAEKNQRIVMYDASPAHAGPHGVYRWAIRIDDPVPGQPLVAQVIALPESFFLLRPPERVSPLSQPSNRPPPVVVPQPAPPRR